MKMEICEKCDMRCHLFKDALGNWTFITNEQVNNGEHKSRILAMRQRPVMWLRHDERTRKWRYCGESYVRYRESEDVVEGYVPSCVLDGIKLDKACRCYAEQVVSELNRC